MGLTVRHRKNGKSSYRIDWVDHTGTRRSATYRTETDAKDALRIALADARQIEGGLKAAPAERHTFEELVAYWFEHRATENRGGRDERGTIATHLTPVLGGVEVREIDRAKLDAVRARLDAARIGVKGRNRGKPDVKGKPYAPRTIQKVLTLLGSMLRLAEELGWISRVPRIRKPSVAQHEVKRGWLRTDAEVARLLTAAQAFDADDEAARQRGQQIKGPREERTHAPGVLPLYATAVYAGLRLGELAALRWTDVDLERGQLRVSRSHGRKTTKGGYARTVPIIDALAPILRAWRLRSPGLLVFPNVNGTQRDEADRVWRETLAAVRERAGLPRLDPDENPITFHSLRHTWASHLVMRGVDLYTLMKMGGWKSYAMVQVYAHLVPEAFDRVRGLIPAPDLSGRGAVLPMGAKGAAKRGSGAG